MLSLKELKELVEISYNYRLKFLEIQRNCGKSIFGGVLSVMDIMTVLFHKIIKHDPKNPGWNKRDIFILSAGHKGLAYYIVLQSMGYFSEEILFTYNAFKTRIPMHPDNELLPCVEFPTGSLGHGLSVGCGIAQAFKSDKEDRKVFVLMGDGEAAEGSVWEAALSAAKYNLDNLILIIDANKLQCDGYVCNILPIMPLDKKFEAFGWYVETIDGHNIMEIYKSLCEIPKKEHKPTCIIALTVKGKGVSFAENSPDHHSYDPVNKDELQLASNDIKSCFLKEINKIESRK